MLFIGLLIGIVIGWVIGDYFDGQVEAFFNDITD